MSMTVGSGASARAHAVTAAREALQQARSGLQGASPKLGLLFVSPKLGLRDALATARQLFADVEFVGCTTAGEITEQGLTQGGISAMLLGGDDMRFESRWVGDVSRDETRAARQLADGFERQRASAASQGFGAVTSLMLVDGINGCGEKLVEDVLRATGTLHDLVGGAAGDAGAFAGTDVGHNANCGTDAAVTVRAFSKHRWGIGVDHGLSPASPMMRVTRAEGAIVHELDGRAAFDVYREFARQKSVELEAARSGSFLINNELGVYLFDQFKMARAPLSVTPSGALKCAAAVPQGASVCIMGGDPGALAAAAGRAAKEAKERLGGRAAAGVLLFDCICRGTIMGQDFDKEIAAVRAVFPNVPCAGFLTYGEIARYSGRLNGWHNTTAVVTAIPA